MKEFILSNELVIQLLSWFIRANIHNNIFVEVKGSSDTVTITSNDFVSRTSEEKLDQKIFRSKISI